MNLGPSFNTSAGEAEPSPSTDGWTLYFSDWWIPHADGSGAQDLWQVPITMSLGLGGCFSVPESDDFECAVTLQNLHFVPLLLATL